MNSRTYPRFECRREGSSASDPFVTVVLQCLLTPLPSGRGTSEMLGQTLSQGEMAWWARNQGADLSIGPRHGEPEPGAFRWLEQGLMLKANRGRRLDLPRVDCTLCHQVRSPPLLSIQGENHSPKSQLSRALHARHLKVLETEIDVWTGDSSTTLPMGTNGEINTL